MSTAIEQKLWRLLQFRGFNIQMPAGARGKDTLYRVHLIMPSYFNSCVHVLG